MSDLSPIVSQQMKAVTATEFSSPGTVSARHHGKNHRCWPSDSLPMKSCGCGVLAGAATDGDPNDPTPFSRRGAGGVGGGRPGGVKWRSSPESEKASSADDRARQGPTSR